MNEVSRRTAMFARGKLIHAELAIDATAQATLADLKIDAIAPDPENPRRHLTQGSLDVLAQSLKSSGLLQPILVRPGEGGAFILIAGERRWRAAKLAGFTTIKAIIRPNLFDASALLLAQVAENEAREDLTTADLVVAVARLVTLGIPKKDIATALATAPSRIARIYALSDLPSSLVPLLETMAVEPLYELLQQYKRDPGAVSELLAEDPLPTRSAVRGLITRGAGEGPAPLRTGDSGPVSLELAPAQADDAQGVMPRAGDASPSRVQIVVRHEKHGEGWVVASPAIMSDRLPILFEGAETSVQVLLDDIHIVSIR